MNQVFIQFGKLSPEQRLRIKKSGIKWVDGEEFFSYIPEPEDYICLITKGQKVWLMLESPDVVKSYEANNGRHFIQFLSLFSGIKI